MSTSAIDHIYKEREKFTIVALTGYTATGCSRLSEIMCDREFYSKLRKPEDIICGSPEDVNNASLYSKGESDRNNSEISKQIFKRKYSICYNYIKVNYAQFTRISYTRMLWLYVFNDLINVQNKATDGNSLQAIISSIIRDKFHPSIKVRDDDFKKRHKIEERLNEFFNVIQGYTKWYELFNIFQSNGDIKNKDNADHLKAYAEIFTDKNSEFNKFLDLINDGMKKAEYYSYCFFYHRLGSQIRKCGDSSANYDDVYETKEYDQENVYNIVYLINLIVKGIRHSGKSNCRIVIDRLRNSLEARYLKERYSAFYLIAVHNETDSEKFLENKIKELYSNEAEHDAAFGLIKDQIKKVFDLGREEEKNDDMVKGNFYSPNTSQCVADAEIHISNDTGEQKSAYFFYTIAEQWLKFGALIQHPGLITPSSEERCMVVAYTAKFNSGCLSRQVGAVITNKAHSIRTIGWNDVPYGQMPCSLRSIFELVGNERAKHVYSDYEISEDAQYDNQHSFTKRIRMDYQYLDHPERYSEMNGLPFSYCFKTLHNRYLSDKNQVFTRSLHAEENAMLQMVRFGGEPLQNGIIYVTASPCELCCKKLYQIGVRQIVYIDEYPGISRQNIIGSGYKRPALKQFQGAYGVTYFKLYQPVMSYKDEIELRIKSNSHTFLTRNEVFRKIAVELDIDNKSNYTADELKEIIRKIKAHRTTDIEKPKKEQG